MPNKTDLNDIYQILGQLQGGQEAILHRMDKQDDKLESIEAQTMKTNGRVTKLEGSSSKQEQRSESFERTFNSALGRIILIGGVIGSGLALIGNIVKTFMEQFKWPQ